MFAKRRKHLESPWSHGAAGVFSDDALKAGQELRNLLIDRYIKGRLVAEDLTLISWYHTKAGGAGLRDFALSPDRKSGFSDHVKVVLAREFPAPPMYHVDVPVYEKLSCARNLLDIPLRLPTQAISEILDGAGEPSDMVDHSAEMWGELFTEHPVVQDAINKGIPWHKIRPLGLYTDAVPFTKNESFVGISIHDLRSGIKILCCTIRPCLTLWILNILLRISVCVLGVLCSQLCELALSFLGFSSLCMCVCVKLHVFTVSGLRCRFRVISWRTKST